MKTIIVLMLIAVSALMADCVAFYVSKLLQSFLGVVFSTPSL